MKTYNCTNCCSNIHDYKDCPEPITSWGIILINLANLKEIITHSNEIKTDTKINIKSRLFNINPSSHEDLQLLSIAMNSIKFLLIQRKHSIGFVDFLRGKYKIDNIDQIIFLFQQMNKTEIQNIASLEFDELWNILWSYEYIKINNTRKEFVYAKEKFLSLKNNLELDLNLDFYTTNVVPLYKFNEWGFPKGRKSKFESPRDCALREFCEETNIDVTNIKLIDSIEPIHENLIGTNGLKYRHIYYIAETNLENINPLQDNKEIEQIQFVSYNDACNLIREYHTEKKEVLTSVYYYYLESLLNRNKSS
jgi:ADP-ribose pyrophosphatase YjhB (NUDIX family)